MANPHLRLFGSLKDTCESPPIPARTPVKRMVTIPLADVLPLLIDAVQSERMWVHDFDDDEMTISSDLYDVLMAYRRALRPSA
jgi:hypothetical protein